MSDWLSATRGVPFSNGTEGDAWMSKWCAFCAHDHDQHEGATVANTGGCDMIMLSMLGGADFSWPEAWLPEPAGEFNLPSKLCCLAFSPCNADACTGDPGAQQRAERVNEVQTFWRTRR